jgi:hypothetical protein
VNTEQPKGRCLSKKEASGKSIFETNKILKVDASSPAPKSIKKQYETEIASMHPHETT